MQKASKKLSGTKSSTEDCCRSGKKLGSLLLLAVLPETVLRQTPASWTTHTSRQEECTGLLGAFVMLRQRTRRSRMLPETS